MFKKLVLRSPMTALILGALAGLFLQGQELIIPHITRVGGGFETEIFVENLSPKTQAFAIQGFDEKGQSLGSVNGELGAKTIRSWTQNALFGPGSAIAHLILNTPSEALKLTASYRASSQPSSPAHVGALRDQAKRWQFFAGNWDVVFDGIAIVNMGSQATDIFLTQRDFNSNPLDRRNIANGTPPRGKIPTICGWPIAEPSVTTRPGKAKLFGRYARMVPKTNCS